MKQSTGAAFLAGVWLMIVVWFIIHGVPNAPGFIERLAVAVHSAFFLFWAIVALEDD